MVKKITFVVLVILLALPVQTFAEFIIKYDQDENGNYNIPYFSFESFPAWSDNGGYFEVWYQPASNEESELYMLRLEGSQGRFYFDACGNWTFFRKFANGDPTPGKTQWQFQIVSNCSDYEDQYDKYQGLDPDIKEDWEGASPINNDKNYNKPDPTNPAGGGNNGGGDGGNGDNGSGGSGGDGGVCECIFNSEGWNDFMDKMDEVIGKIPPPPNWNEVAETFRDAIVPSVISDLDNLLGRAPTPPTAPSMPKLPTQPKLEGSVTTPTGNSIPSGGNFDANDIKNDAIEIPVREDPTGGFSILNPLDALPTQEEFKQNIPTEVDNFAPEVPDMVDGVPAPVPPENENPLPSEPTGGTIEPPTPPDFDGTVPVPGDNNGGNAPIPGDGGGSAPIPGESGGTAPIPDNEFGNFPIPGGNTGTFPIPGNDFGSFPIPGIGGGTVPIPGDNSGSLPIPNK